MATTIHPPNTIDGPAKSTPQYGNQKETGADDHYCQKNPLGGKLGMHISIAGAEDYPPCGEDQFPDAKPVTPSEKAQDGYDQSTNMG
ncbi:unnamed protein product [marine sediment metagenome]|uniref:Uncharacterized protein n=1 Tax=marine sediment metagenome TaxID=412755 RepID=X1Q871_9ZZZZ